MNVSSLESVQKLAEHLPGRRNFQQSENMRKFCSLSHISLCLYIDKFHIEFIYYYKYYYIIITTIFSSDNSKIYIFLTNALVFY